MTTIQNQPQQTPKSQLEGMTLADGWTLVERLQPTIDSTGGTFGVGYKATKGNEIAFVKAIDFVEALNSSDPIGQLAILTSIANFEKEILEYCTQRKMSKVLKYIGHEYIFPKGTEDPTKRVSCLIMEAGTEDLRRLVNKSSFTSCAWNLQVMRDISQAVAQLHEGGIAHQDLKPSNVIAVQENDLKNSKSMKVGDLGRVIHREKDGPFDSHDWAGDTRYSPPESWYKYIPPQWCDSRDASDAYMLGSLLIYLFTGATLQSLVREYIPVNFLPENWAGSFDEDLLPVLVDAHSKVLTFKLLPLLESNVADGVMDIARSLTQPDPSKRGDAKARRQIGRPVGIDRIHQKFTLLSLTCMAVERGAAKK